MLSLALIGWAYYFSQKPTVISTNSIAQWTIQVTGDGQAKAIPDTVILSAGVEILRSATQADAMNAMNESMAQIKTILKNAGIEEKNIQTANIYASQDYSYENGKQVPNGYRASEDLTIRIEKKDKSTTDTLIDLIGKVPNIRITNVGYATTDTTAVYTEARKLALQKARQKAEEIAATTGLKIKKVQSVSEWSNERGMYPMQMNVKAMAANDQSMAGGSDISVGQLEYSISLNVVYEVE